MTFISPGHSATFTTRVVGQRTLLTAKNFTSPGVGFNFTWRKELCCQPVNYVWAQTGKITVDISAAGALVTVTSDLSNRSTIDVVTDYI